MDACRANFFLFFFSFLNETNFCARVPVVCGWCGMDRGVIFLSMRETENGCGVE